jgi:hypothetical protein
MPSRKKFLRVAKYVSLLVALCLALIGVIYGALHLIYFLFTLLAAEEGLVVAQGATLLWRRRSLAYPPGKASGTWPCIRACT